jgi:integrase
MASIVTPKSQPKHRWIQFTAPSGKRCTVRLGVCTDTNASDHKRVIESIVSSKLSNEPLEPRIARFIGDLSPVLRDRYERAGLVTPSEPEEQAEPETEKQMKLGVYLDSFQSSRKLDVKESSQVAMGHAVNRLREFFGNDCPLADITPFRAKEFRTWMASTNKRDKKNPKPLSLSTLRRRTGFCKQIFASALEDGIIERNPFHKLKASVKSNKKRAHYIPMNDVSKLIAAAPNARWRALIALARVAALRVPSEVVGLKWDHIRFEEKRILVLDSSKTQHHDGYDMRKIPMMPILEKHLLAWQLECQPGERVFPGIDADTNLRTTFQKIITKAGVKPWPKLWQNLRASGATDYAKRLPAHIAAAICGHTEQIAKEHYWQVREEDLDSLIADEPEAGPEADLKESAASDVNCGNQHSENTKKKPGNQQIPRSTSGRYWTRKPKDSQGISHKKTTRSKTRSIQLNQVVECWDRLTGSQVDEILSVCGIEITT